jgi:hypothetical protein
VQIAAILSRQNAQLLGLYGGVIFRRVRRGSSLDKGCAYEIMNWYGVCGERRSTSTSNFLVEKVRHY